MLNYALPFSFAAEVASYVVFARFQNFDDNALFHVPLSLNQFGRCYTFNSGKPGHQLLHVSAPGRSRELTMELDAEPAEYYGPLGRGSTGFRIFIHHQSDREPIMEDVSDAISTGFSHEFKILRKEVILH